ncbi:HNH endonuclease signature motif containing protein [Microbacterium sp. T2.11-28]|uniref:HNH endonuclease signature motif containing protein n=1 Tax=Microbacterium sp. T2.11-28 TaxID=3041169 RepID=UPI00247788DF|nr:HNH endonuclease signature motif containing protein [Microbacterium sp. T2.11-28]CAI9394405.1 hypothetical protein MICABA_02773 [Microbacterium sp. T2.11-28]
MNSTSTTARSVVSGDASGDVSVTRIESLLEGLAEAGRQAAAAHARHLALLAEALEVADAQADAGAPAAVRDIPLRSLAAQIGATLRVSDRTVQRQLSEAWAVSTRFAATLGALASGDITRAHVRVIVDAGSPIDDDEARAAYEAAALEIARRETPGRLRPAARLLAGRLHPMPLDERHRVAAAGRDVWVRDLDDGMAEIIAVLPTAIAHAIRDRLDQYARRQISHREVVDGEDDPVAGAEPVCRDLRGVGEVRADVFADLLLTGHATAQISDASIPEGEAIVARVQVTVPVLTVLGADTAPAELVGHAPIDTATACRLAAGAPGWDRVLTHPVTGTVLAVDRYRPSDQLKRALQVRDEHCRFPGCRMPTRRCDIDHTIAREHDGPTELGNLAHLCRRHHTLKHHSAWRVRQTPDGVLHWTTPTGRIHVDRPAQTLTFTPVDDAEPPPPF